MGWLRRRSVEVCIARQDFLARRNEFLVPGYGESVDTTSERTGILDPPPETSSPWTPPAAIESAESEAYTAQPGIAREIRAIPRGSSG
jgi:hypothetical protein